MVLLIVAESCGAWDQLCYSKQHYLCEWHWWIFPYSLSWAMLLMLLMELSYHTKIVCSGEFVNESLGPLLLSDLISEREMKYRMGNSESSRSVFTMEWSTAVFCGRGFSAFSVWYASLCGTVLWISKCFSYRIVLMKSQCIVQKRKSL